MLRHSPSLPRSQPSCVHHLCRRSSRSKLPLTLCVYSTLAFSCCRSRWLNAIY
ncbi:hypothetical protein BDQ12DRAFT_692344, partial [Crucibulum laeve]